MDRNNYQCITQETKISHLPVFGKMINKHRRRKRLERIKQIREGALQYFMEKLNKIELNEKEEKHVQNSLPTRSDPFIPTDYSVYEIPGDKRHIVVDDAANIFVETGYVNHLKDVAENIKKNGSKLAWQTRHTRRRAENGHYKMPRIIGLWRDDQMEENDRWPFYDSRDDTEQEYFSRMTHNLIDYIDDDWNEQEKRKVYIYLHVRKRPVNSIIINRSYLKKSGCFNICTDGTYLWHESLEDFVRLYNVRPPKFFVDHILYTGYAGKTTR